ncbi:BTAD domain-containing putative transcriptional regulator [Umezawaea endophytica]|uniref:Tetratricopeptide repeat protein n=1 Tax=Umezawaea endophytica TaxID=1654476 RepID=A0A9X2VJ30_9PSEU|nr:tetratricopeptide repeat protein [Umezawaea endophytica]
MELGPPQQRSVLALLLAHGGQPVSVASLVDALWGEDHPGSAVNLLHRYVGALRRALEPELGHRETGRWLIRGAGGYRFTADAATLDLLRFRDLMGKARSERDGGAERQAVHTFAEALALWDGPVAANTPAPVRSHTVFTALEREHVAAVNEATDLALRCGLPKPVLVPLQWVTSQHPFDEPSHSRLILALAAAGYRADALDVHATIRGRLAEELGIDPGAELRAAHEAVLREEPDQPQQEVHHETEPLVDAPMPAPSVMPAQLPRDLAVFAGRRDELDHLLAEHDDPHGATAVTLIRGMAGVGKTTLAVRYVHRIAHLYPDGQLYLNLRGFDQTGDVVQPEAAVRRFLDELGVPSARIPVGFDAQVNLYRSVLAERRILVVLDNARDAEQVRPLLPGSPGCHVVVTSRNQLLSLVAVEGARPLLLTPLSNVEAREFLTRRLGSRSAGSDPAAISEIIELCAGLPLALAIVAARAALQPLHPLSAVAQALRDTSTSLDSFSDADSIIDARAAFTWSYQALGPAAADMFRVLSLHPSPEIPTRAAASLMGLPVARAVPLLDELERGHLIAQYAPRRYTMHDLVRVYATELANASDAPEARRAARVRVLDHYLHSSFTAAALIDPHRPRITLPPMSEGAVVEVLHDRAAAQAWTTAVSPTLFAAVEMAGEHHLDDHTWRLAWAFDPYLDRNGHWHQKVIAQEAALAATERAHEVRGRAYVHRSLGYAHKHLGNLVRAAGQFRSALELYVELGDLRGEGRTHQNIADLCTKQNMFQQALEHEVCSYEIARVLGDQLMEADCLNNVGCAHSDLGDHDQAIVLCEQALARSRELGNRPLEAAAQDSLGKIHHRAGRYAVAVGYLGQALETHRDLQDLYNEAVTLRNLAAAHLAVGDKRSAEDCTRLAATVLGQPLPFTLSAASAS